MRQNLSIEDIQFIDTYLKNSEIMFTDIRVEMVDHVASEIETRINEGDNREFYYVFKDYMVENKSGLIKNHRNYYKVSDKKIFRYFKNQAFSFKGLAMLLVIYLIFQIFENVLQSQQFMSIVKYSPAAIMIIAIIIYYALARLKKERYSSLERIGFYFMVISHFVYNFPRWIFDSDSYVEKSINLVTAGSTLIIWMTILLIMAAIQFYAEYHNKFVVAK